MENYILSKNLKIKNTINKYEDNFVISKKTFKEYEFVQIMKNSDKIKYRNNIYINKNNNFYYEYGWSTLVGEQIAHFNIEDKLNIFDKKYNELDGQYVHITIIDDVLKVTKDLTSLSTTLYYHDGEHLLISNDMAIMISILEENNIKITENKKTLVARFNNSYSTFGTIYNEIKYIESGEQFIYKENIITTKLINKIKDDYLEKLYKKDREYFWDYVTKRYLNSLDAQLKMYNGNEIICDLTGGKDSRFILSIYMKLIGKENIVINTGGEKHNSDKIISNEIVNYYDLKTIQQKKNSSLKIKNIIGVEEFEGILKSWSSSHFQRVKYIGLPKNKYKNPLNIRAKKEIKVSGASGNIIRCNLKAKVFNKIQINKDVLPMIKKEVVENYYNDLELVYEKLGEIVDKQLINFYYNLLYNKHNSSFYEVLRIDCITFNPLAMDLLCRVNCIIALEGENEDALYFEIMSRINQDMIYLFGHEQIKMLSNKIEEFNIQSYDGFLVKVASKQNYYFIKENLKLIINDALENVDFDKSPYNKDKINLLLEDYSLNKYNKTIEVIYYLLIHNDNLKNINFKEIVLDEVVEVESKDNIYTNISYEHNKFAYGVNNVYQIGDYIYGVATTTKNIIVSICRFGGKKIICQQKVIAHSKVLYWCQVTEVGDYIFKITENKKIIYQQKDLRVVEKYKIECSTKTEVEKLEKVKTTKLSKIKNFINNKLKNN